MDVKIFSVVSLLIFSLLFYTKKDRTRVLCACALISAVFLFLLSRALETLAASFLVSVILSSFSFKESFSVVDYRKERNEWTRAKEFFEKNRLTLLVVFALFHVFFFFIYSILKQHLLPPVIAKQVLSHQLGIYVISSHWIGVFVLFVTSAILLNVSGRKSK